MDVIAGIRKDNGIVIPHDLESHLLLCEQDGFLDLDIRRDFFMKDAIREGKKPKFVANKLIKVSCTCTCNPNYIFYMHVG